MLQLKREYVEAMVAQAKREAPNECCGMLGGKNGRALQIYPSRNAEASPTRYSVDSGDLMAAVKDMDAHGWELVAIYHSHTHTQAYPSATDISLAFYPESVYIIISLAEPEPLVRGFRIVDGKIIEEELVVVERTS